MKRIQRYPVKKIFSVRTLPGFSISSDDKSIFYITNTTGSPQIWRVSIDGGRADQISTWNDSVKEIFCIPKSESLIFMSDIHGNENLQLYYQKLDGSDPVHITSGFEDSQCFLHAFSKKGTEILFSSNKRLKYNFDAYIHDLKSGKNRIVYEFQDYYPTQPYSWSGDKRYFTFLKFYGNINSDILLYDSKNNTIENITEHDIKKNVFNAMTEFDKESRGFYYISDEERENKGLKYYDIKKRKSEWIIKDKWDITSFDLSHEVNSLVYTVNVNGNNSPRFFNLKKNEIKKLKIQKGNFYDLKFTHDGKKIVFICESPLNPPDIFSYDLKKEKSIQITNSFVGGVSKKGLTVPKDIFYESFDGLKIHALLYIPKGAKKDGTNPAIVWPHGGPESQEIHNYRRPIQVLVNAGYIVIAPNFRGSTGYGKSFQKMIYKDWGGSEFKDVLESVEYLKKTGYVDSKKIAVVGGSFGGFMVMTCITKAPDLWKCAVDVFGPANLFSFMKSVPEHWKMGIEELVGSPERDKDLLFERSPINFVDNIMCPLLVIQGKHDPRVVESESVQIVSKLKEKNKPVEYLLLEDEGHGFSKVSNEIKVFELIIEFLEKHLK